MIDIVDGPAMLMPDQISLRHLFSVDRLLASRGFQIEDESTSTVTLLPNTTWTFDQANQIFSVFDSDNQRSDLLNWISVPTAMPVEREVSDLTQITNFERDRNRFSSTFEWYVGELLVRKFKAFSSSFGVKVAAVVRNSDGGTSGDFDVLSILSDMSLLYIECKSGACTQKSIVNTIQRSLSLHSHACVIFMGAGTNEQALKQQLRGLAHPIYKGLNSVNKLSTRNVANSEVYNWYDCFFLPGDQSVAVEPKLRTVLRVMAAERASNFGSMKPDAAEYNSRGYNCDEIPLG